MFWELLRFGWSFPFCRADFAGLFWHAMFDAQVTGFCTFHVWGGFLRKRIYVYVVQKRKMVLLFSLDCEAGSQVVIYGIREF